MSNAYDIGDQVELDVTFTDLAGAAADPTTVVCTVRDPAGVQTTPAVAKDGVGLYHATITVATAGTWSYWFMGTGALVAATPESHLFVRPR